jgi:hypothetical protein
MLPGIVDGDQGRRAGIKTLFLLFNFKIMATVIVIPKKASKKKVKEILEKVESLKKGKMAKHFGALKRGINALEYQKKLRDEWN